IFVKGKVVKTVPESKIVDALVEEAIRLGEQLTNTATQEEAQL
ncbi:4-hydroxy-3-methylbut-2-en-1-yl diphosphate synthase, partial [Streptomyces sp. AD681]|nr:4-hydroxy-3-methylbut-2-en-1-yl diphosphate synthase [Streptomyces sp. AD681]